MCAKAAFPNSGLNDPLREAKVKGIRPIEKTGIKGKKRRHFLPGERSESLPFPVLSGRLAAQPSAKVPAAERIYDLVLERICGGRYAPGMRINEQTLAEEMEVSVIPVREAMQRLIEVGWVKRIPNRGIVVDQMHMDAFEECWQLREAYELWSIRHLAPRITKTQLAHLKQVAESLKTHDVQYAIESVQIIRAEIDFHTSLIRMAGNARMESLAIPLITKVITYEAVYFYKPFIMEIVTAYQEKFGKAEVGFITHYQICEALANGDAGGAEQLLQRHLTFGFNAHGIVAKMMDNRLLVGVAGI